MLTARALVLDVGHRALVLRAPDGSWHPPGTVARVGERPLVALRAFALERLGLDLPYPMGARDTPVLHEFAFVLPPATALEANDAMWVPMREIASATDRAEADGLWAIYVDAVLGGWTPPTRAIDVFHFGGDARSAAVLAHYVVKGRKRATALWPEAARVQGETIPTPGMVSVVTDGFGVPVCAIRTERVDDLRFGDVDESVAADEAEGDRTLDDWREGHRAYFQREASALGLTFDDDTIVMIERFSLLHVLRR